MFRARTKAYQREMEEMDVIADSYKHTLRSLGYRHNRKTSAWERPSANSFTNRDKRNPSQQEKENNSDDDKYRRDVQNEWKQAKKNDNPAFPSMTRSIKVDSARDRIKGSKSRQSDSSSEDDLMKNFYPSQSAKSRNGQSSSLLDNRATMAANEILIEDRKVLSKRSTNQQSNFVGNESDSDEEFPPNFHHKQESRPDVSRPVADDDYNRTAEITQKSKQATRGSTIASVPNMDGRAREIRPIQVKAASISSSPPDMTKSVTSQATTQPVTLAPSKQETPPKGKASPPDRSSKQSSPDSDPNNYIANDITKRSAASFGAPSTGAISLDSLNLDRKTRSESKDDYKSDSRSRSPSPRVSSRADSPNIDSRPTSSMSKQSLANTYPVRNSTPESKVENESLMKSSSAIYHISNSSIDMESFEDHNSFADLPPLQSKEITTKNAGNIVSRVSKNDLYLEDSEDFRDDVYPPSPSPFKKMAEESKSYFRDGGSQGRTTPSSLRGSGRTTPLSMRGVESHPADPYDAHNADMHRMMHRNDDDDDLEEYSQSFVSSAASPMRMIDTSRSTVLELNFDTVADSKAASDSYATNSGPGTRDYPSSRSSPSVMNYGGTVDSFTRRVSNGDDDAVLMGTAKFSQTGGYNYSDTSSKSRLSGTGTENIERDSLGGTFTNTEKSNSKETVSPNGDDSSPPPAQKHSFEEGSSFESFLGRRTPSVSELSKINSSNNQVHDLIMDSDINDRFTSNLADDVHAPPGQLRWEKGRSPLDLIELSEAFDVHISGIKVYPGIFNPDLEVYLEIEFLDTKSPPSQTVRLDNNDLPVAVSYSSCKYFFFCLVYCMLF